MTHDRKTKLRRERRQRAINFIADDHGEEGDDNNGDIMGIDEEVITEKGQKWVKLTAVMDSGAIVPVLPKNCVPHIPVKSTALSRSGKKYRGAGGHAIANLGEKKMSAITNEGHRRSMTWQVCDVQKALISAAKVVEAGNDVYLENANPRIVNRKTGQVTKLLKENGVFVVDLWIAVGNKGDDDRKDQSGFTRQER